MNVLKNIFNFCLAGILLFFIVPQFNLPGVYKLFLVQSGSMSPTINTGDMVIVQPSKHFYQNDIITFVGSSFTTTHRLINIDGQNFTTKGDANQVSDQEKINQSQVVGKVNYIIPKIGYLIMFTKTLPGLIILIIIPSTVIVWQELLKIKKTFHSKR